MEAAPVIRWWTSPRSIAFVALAIAIIAAAVAVAAWLRPSASHSYSDAQSAQAKANVCAAWAPVHQSIWKGTPNPQPGDPVAQLAVAANVRLAELGGGSYLKQTLAEEGATPAALSTAVNTVATTLQRLGVNYLAGNETQAVLAPLLSKLDSQGAAVDKLCK
jgi:hypothetical protein